MARHLGRMALPDPAVPETRAAGGRTGHDGVWADGTALFDVVAESRLRLCQEAPKVPPNDLRLYSTKRAADDIKELAKQLGEERIVLGGHDWYVFSICGGLCLQP
jgi:pimeloyl-ACP methyl ester carboxylesterase